MIHHVMIPVLVSVKLEYVYHAKHDNNPNIPFFFLINKQTSRYNVNHGQILRTKEGVSIFILYQ